MPLEENYLEINKKLWNKRTSVHYSSAFYDVEGFIKGKSSLNEIELELLGNFKGKKILHLQCHFGQDSISLARLGAEVTAVDFSDVAIKKAEELSSITNTSVHFICADIYDLPNHLTEQFDIVFTSYGTIGWLPDMEKWSKIVQHFLKPEAKFIFVEFHPVIWMFDDDFNEVGYNYFNAEAIIESENGSYADRNADLSNDSIGWNHPISEVVNNLIAQNLDIKTLNEYDYSPYSCFRGIHEFEPGKYRIEKLGNKIPMVYSIVAIKK